ncbi:hypothetical protein L3Q82_015709 [Scortum barcoo]|uniref:Uncharacterized protein n=1 Tax=Scortum barcoo TaxID=214431 RepID=A0ACB8VQS2_9TELE|nr:hypothetical protein L3Q82_015709 [Scortum barcoo]
MKNKLKKDLLKKILSQNEVKELKQHETDTELYEIETAEKKNEKAQTYDKLFLKSNKKKVRTVLTKGLAGVGKTFQTRKFEVDWAEGKSNKKIDMIVSFDFRKLNSRRNEVQSMNDLLHHYLNDGKHSGIWKYDECKIAFVLDGLEKCELPLDFKKNKDLTDMNEAASMDVLLTNLIMGKLLPSAHVWIISQPSGVDKIPPEHIQKVTECRETLKRWKKLISACRNRFLEENTQVEDTNHPNQKNTEHIMREARSSEVKDDEKTGSTVKKSVTPVNEVSDIFKDTKGQKIRSVLTVGERDIGKSYYVQKFIKEWAKNDSKSYFFVQWAKSAMSFFGKAEVDEEVIFPLNFSKLNLIKENISLVGLLNYFFKETKEFVISNFEQYKVFFVLDGLDAVQCSLDFYNNKTLTDVREPASVSVLLTNLIRGKLLPSARLWITSRPDKTGQVRMWTNRTTEIRYKPDVASQWKLKSQLKEQFTHISEGIEQKTSALLNEIYTDLYIIEGERGEVNVQHEARQVQEAKFKPVTQETSVKYQDIFKPASGENKTDDIRTVLTTGVAGIGKSFATMKYMLDWAEDKANGDIFYMFPLSFRELNLRKNEEHSMEELLNIFFPGMRTSEITDYDKYKILIVLDGFDECRLDLAFNENNDWTDVTEKTSVNVLLTNLMKGKLLSEAKIWITSRPAASNRIPAAEVARVTEVRGFNDEQKEKYFSNRFSDKDLAEKILSHVKKSRSLYIMCHIPVFCWITSKVLEDLVKTDQEGRMPKTLTDMYIYFLLLQCRQANVKYAADEAHESCETDSCWNPRNRETIISLGKVAFEGLVKGDLLFTEENLTESGANITETAVFSGLFTQIKREGHGVSQQELFCFVHLSIQEFMAAFYVFYNFNNKGENLFTTLDSTAATDFYKSAVDKALHAENGEWDLFLRFLLGLSLEINQELMQELLIKKENNKETNKKTIQYIKRKIKGEISDADKNMNLFHCLNELNDDSLLEEVKKYLHSDKLSFEDFSPSMWSALTFVLLTSDEDLDVFDLKKYLKKEEVLIGMLPVVKVSKTALLSWCELSEKSCQGLQSSVLSSASSNLTELDLSNNDLMDSGVEMLAKGLENIHCKLEILKLSGCQVTEKGCSFLASALKSKKGSSLKQLDLSYNHPGVNGEAMLSAIAEDPKMSLKTLCVRHGGEHRLKPGIKKYGVHLEFDENTASKRLVLSEESRKVKTAEKVEEKVDCYMADVKTEINLCYILLDHNRSVSAASGNIPEDDPLNFTPHLSSPQSQRPDSNVPSSASMKSEQSKDRDKLKKDLQKKILSQNEVKELKQHETDTELYEIETAEKKNEKAQTYDELFLKSNKKKVRTVLTKGLAGVGKTFQTRKFMVDWAKGKSNKKIDMIVSFDFRKLNSRRVQSMNDLLHHYLNDGKCSRVWKYDECKIAFVLDGLEKCELPLDFEKNKDLTDMNETASMDVLLTNLIMGKLLPSAHVWIISQPSGVDKIPPEHIKKVTECRETLKRWKKLISACRKRFLEENTQVEDTNHPNQRNTEHIMREARSSEVKDDEKTGSTVNKSVTPVNEVSDIFKDTKGQKIRSVLTIGERDIGKSYYVQKFIKEWAKNDSKSYFFVQWAKSAMSFFGKAEVDEEVIFSLNFSKLNLIKENISLVGLLNYFFKETKEFVISNFEQYKVFFVLDGLDAVQCSLDFDNNKTLTDVREPASVSVLLTNLIRGKLLPSARLWITSRPDKTGQVRMWTDRTTEIRYKPDVASQWKLKSQLKEQFTHVSEGTEQKTSALLNEIYTDLYIIEGERGEVNVQHEARQVQEAKFKPVTQETSIKYQDIFKPASGENKTDDIRTVLTTGVAGIGKSFATMKYMLDWAEDKANGDIFYMFPLSFRELNLRKNEEHSMEELLNIFFPGMRTSEITDYDKYKILIVLDGFDECRLDLAFNENNDWTDVTEKTSVNVLLTNLIKGKLLSEAKIWITSRPAASNRIPAAEVARVTEVRGFNDEQKEKYFSNRFSDKDLAEKILSHVKKSRSLYIMCHIPVFCWITSKVLEDLVKTDQEGRRMPKTLTDMYIYFLLLQCRHANVKYAADEAHESCETDSCWNPRNRETIISLGKLAFEGLVKGDLLFTEENLTESGANITETAVFSGLFTQIKREGHGVSQQELFCFVHLSIQEFMAAFYVFYNFNNKGENLLTTPDSTAATDFYKTAVDKALHAENGEWDLFLRFLLGLSLEINQELMQELLIKKENNKETNKETIEYIKGKIRGEISDADKNMNLFHCLNELNDDSLLEEVKKYLHSDKLSFEDFSPSMWSALTFVLLTSDEELDVFDLKKYQKKEEVLIGMLPVVKVSKTALLSWCELSEKSCQGLQSSVLSSASSNLTELDLSNNDLMDSGVEMLAKGLENIHCKLEILKLSGCQVTEKGCSLLASALKSKKGSSLKQLDLSYNHPGVNGEAMLSAIAEDPKMSLKTLCVRHGGEHRLKPGMKKYGVHLEFDENTVSKRLVLSEESRKVKIAEKVEEKVSRPDSVDRFKRTQVFCKQAVQSLSYWEVEWRGVVGIAVAYRAVGRQWDSSGGLGSNEKSWSLICSSTGYTAMHGKTSKHIELPNNEKCHTIAVLLDWEGGTLTYYSVISGKLTPIHTFHVKFTEPLFPGFWFKKGSVTLCEID